MNTRTGSIRLVTARSFVTLLACALTAALGGRVAMGATRQISREVLEDKVRGGWAGKMFGVSYGAPTEFRSNGRINEGEITWAPERVDNALQQDDLYVGMTFSETLDRLGLDATTEEFGEAFKSSQYHLWHANAGARRLLNQGIKAPWSGHPKYNVHANDIDFQIEADFIGLMSPGLPRVANEYCDRVGRVMNYGDGLYGGMWLCGMYSAAFFESDVRRVVEQGLESIPARSSYALLIRDVLNWTAEEKDWRKVWQRVQDKWDRDDPCPDGALQPFNIDARINGAYIAIGLLCGEGDYGKTLEITTRCGQDSDCNPSSAAGVLGVITGYKAIPEQWKSGIPALARQKFAFTQSSYEDICNATLARALKLVERAGGKVRGREIVIPRQKPKAARLEQWDMGKPLRRVNLDTAAKWEGKWTDLRQGKPAGFGMSCQEAGAQMELRFEASAIAVTGEYSPAGGRAEVYLDGRKMRGIDAYAGANTHDNDLWHAYGLKPGPHVLKIVTLPDAHPESSGRKVVLAQAVLYK